MNINRSIKTLLLCSSFILIGNIYTSDTDKDKKIKIRNFFNTNIDNDQPPIPDLDMIHCFSSYVLIPSKELNKLYLHACDKIRSATNSAQSDVENAQYQCEVFAANTDIANFTKKVFHVTVSTYDNLKEVTKGAVLDDNISITDSNSLIWLLQFTHKISQISPEVTEIILNKDDNSSIITASANLRNFINNQNSDYLKKNY